MKYLSKYKVCLAFLLALTFSACDRGFEELNVDPVNPTDVPAETILTSATESVITRLLGASLNLTYADTWAQQIAKIQYIDEDRYAFRPDAIDAHWESLYSGPLYDFKVIIDKANDSNSPNMEAIGRIMKAYTFHNITDLWGDVPYFEALQGAEGSFRPKYDAQKDIYMDLLSELKKANDLINEDADEVGRGDIMYNGDVMKWKKFANSLRLRLLMRMSKVEPATAQAGIEEIFTDPAKYPVFTSNSDDAELNYLTSRPYRNPIFENGVTRDDHGVSKTLVDLLKSKDDPRLTIYAEPNKDGEYRGQPNGAISQPNIADISRIGKKFRNEPTSPLYVLTYAEVLFIKAEAAQNGWSVGVDAKTAYESAIKASFEKHGADIGNYLLHPEVSYDLASDKYKVIGEQKWLALFMQGVEAFSEYRRTGYPNTIVEPEGSAFPGRGIPLRFPYAAIEASYNPENFNAARQGIVDFLYGKNVWWDVN
jgi:hypothetical protein